MPIVALLFCATLFLAYSNGANDNFKGVATLFGSKTVNYRIAILWATLTTCIGSALSVVWASELVKSFSGKGLVPDAIASTNSFHLAVAASAGITVILATLIGFPISTTHGLTGALVGAGLVAIGLQVNFAVLGKLFVLPLLLSPVGAIALAGLTYWLARHVRITAKPLLTIAHFISAGIVSLARGLNDTPKIVALMWLGQGLSAQWNTVLVGAAIAIGGWLNSRRVAQTMSQEISLIDPEQGLSANVITGFLVILASRFGLPVSTTHVAVGSIFGVGVVSGMANGRVFLKILLSWLLTLPIAALLSAVIYAAIGGVYDS
jgi:inorganic phosphate transporter, PiT family